MEEYVDEWVIDYSCIPWEKGVRIKTGFVREVEKVLKEVLE